MLKLSPAKYDNTVEANIYINRLIQQYILFRNTELIKIVFKVYHTKGLLIPPDGINSIELHIVSIMINILIFCSDFSFIKYRYDKITEDMNRHPIINAFLINECWD